MPTFNQHALRKVEPGEMNSSRLDFCAESYRSARESSSDASSQVVTVASLGLLAAPEHHRRCRHHRHRLPAGDVREPDHNLPVLAGGPGPGHVLLRPAGVPAHVQQLRVRRLPEQLLLQRPPHRLRPPLARGRARPLGRRRRLQHLFNVSSAFAITDRFRISASNRGLYVLSKCDGTPLPPAAVPVTITRKNSDYLSAYPTLPTDQMKKKC
jgi:hypothetical protein